MTAKPPRTGIPGIVFAAALLLAAGGSFREAQATTPADLTGMSLDELMNVEVPATGRSARFQVSATAVDSCNVTATDLFFGNYDSLAASPTDQSASVVIVCTADSGYTIGLDAGTGSGATTAARKLTGGAGTINYSLYRDGARTQVWGNSPGSDTVAGVGTGLPSEYTIYGRIPPRQPARRGTYSDVITVSVSY
ncbi:MAG TPA: spore coat U domain-containing protein [Rhodocyclaceae bacterium]|nr:spore coat U domain-containing protein [Rhodocyclaceae bacterium]